MNEKRQQSDHPWTVFLIPHFHYDPAWVATPEFYATVATENIKALLDNFDCNPEYRFCLDQVVLLEEFKKRYPNDWPKLEQAVANHQVELVGGMYAMPDLHIPSGESLVRQFLYGKRYFQTNFDKSIEIGWIIDPWGQPHQLPQILRKAGFKYYVFWRGMPYDAPSEFYWQAPDKTSIITHWMPIGYGTEDRYSYHDLNQSSDLLKSHFNVLKRRAVTKNVLLTEGGDFTPPDPLLLKFIKSFNTGQEDITLKIATPTDFFQELSKHLDKLETIPGEFLAGRYTQLTPGTWDSRMWVKQGIRECEFLAMKAERLATILLLLNHPYPSTLIETAWKTLLYNQFHDIACGCCIDEVYDQVHTDFTSIKEIFNSIIDQSLENIAKSINTDYDGQPVVVLNILTWGVTGPAETKITFDEPGTNSFTLLDHDRNEIPFQINDIDKYKDGSLKTAHIVFLAENIPALGYKVFQAIPSRQTISKPRQTTSHTTLENTYFTIRIDPQTGAIQSIYDKKHKKEVLAKSGNEIVVESDVGDVFYHQYSVQLPQEPIVAEYSEDREQQVVHKIQLIERGPVRSRIVTQSDYFAVAYQTVDGLRPSPLSNLLSWTKQITLYNNIPRVDFVMTLNNQHRHVRIRTRFPVSIWQNTLTCETIYGAVERPIHQPKDLAYRSKLYDFDPVIHHITPDAPWLEKPFGTYPVQNWMDFGTDEYGVSLINFGIPAHEVRDNTIFMTLLRSVDMETLGYGGPYIPTPKALEHGTHEFKYCLYPHEGNWKQAKTYKVAYEHNCPLITQSLPKKSGELPPKSSFLEVAPDNLLVLAVKKSEDDDSIIIRCVEMEGCDTEGCLSFYKDIKQAFSTNLLEQPQTQLQTDLRSVYFNVKAYEILTLKIYY
jgi:alpha-mannosidase